MDIIFMEPSGMNIDSTLALYAKYKPMVERKFDKLDGEVRIIPDFAPYFFITCDFPDTNKGCKSHSFRMVVNPDGDIQEADFKHVLEIFDQICIAAETRAPKMSMDNPTRDMAILFKDNYWHEMNYATFENDSFVFQPFLELETKGKKWDYIEIECFIRKK